MDKDTGIRQFAGTDFADWKFRMSCLFEEKELTEFITNPPNEEDLTDDDYVKEERRAKNLIVKHVANSHINFVKNKQYAYDMWENLTSTFEPKSRTKRVLLRRKLNSIKCTDDETLETFFLRFDRLVVEYRSAGGDMEEDDLVETLLASLPDRFDNIVTILETMEECTYDKAKTALLERELKMVDKTESVNVEQPSSVAFVSKKGKFKEGYRNRKKKAKKHEIQCYTCHEFGHKSPNCPKKSSTLSNNQTKSSFAFMSGVEERIIRFYVDSGASEHWIIDRNNLTNEYVLDKPLTVQIAKEKESMEVKHGGTMHLLSKVSNEREMETMDVTLDVYVAEGLRHNLLSVQRIESRGGSVTFANGKVTISVKGKVVAEGFRLGKMYVVEFVLNNEDALAACQNQNDLWHRRLGHLGMSNVCKLVNGELATGVNVKLVDDLPFCESCVKGKQARAPFNRTRPATTRPLERIHSDVCGPMDVQAIDGSRYFVTFTDDFTHLTVTYLIENKSNTFSKFQEYHEMATAHFNLKMGVLRSDRGGEYLSNQMKQYCKNKGVILETNAGYNPESNGVAERINRTLMEKARSMLVDSGLEKNLWGEAVIASTYLTNRSPTSVLKDKTPCEMWFGRKPDLSNIRVFGSRAFAHIPDVQRKKLDDRSKEYIMVGYDYSGYRLYDSNTRQVVIRRNVVFDESVPDLTINDSSHLENNNSGEHLNTNINPKSPISRLDSTISTVQSPKAESPHPGSSTSTEGDMNQIPTPTPRRNPPRTCRNNIPYRLEDYELNMALSAVSWVKNEPLCYNDVLGRKDESEWLKAIDKELNSLAENDTWEIVAKQVNSKLLGTRWIFKLKDEPNERKTYKARLVVRGFQQREGIDYAETYAPVARMATIRMVLAISVQKHLHTRHLDVTTAFLYGKLEEEVYLRTPDGVSVPEGGVIRLKKSLYGLKQSPKCWNDRFNKFILSLGFTQSKSDYCLYVWSTEHDIVYLVLYVDDTLLAGSNINVVDSIVQKLSSEFKMKDLGPVKRFMGLNVTIEPDKIEIDQAHYIRKILEKFSMENCNPVRTPMEVNLKVSNTNDEKTDQPYRELVGTLMFLAMGSRPDISYAVNFFSRYQEKATEQHWLQLKRILRYLRGTTDIKLVYKFNSTALPISAFVDADWGSDIIDRKSTSGYVLFVFDCPILWQSKKQSIVALSTTEAEYVAVTSVATEIIWVRKLFVDLGMSIQDTTIVYEDNQGTIAMSKTPETRRTKHVDIRFNFLRDLVQDKVLCLKYVPTSQQLADIFTKSLSREQHENLKDRIMSGSVADRE